MRCFLHPHRMAYSVALVFLLAAMPLHAKQASLTVTSSDIKSAVVELYTSEGCSSCPPADQWLANLGKLDNEEIAVIPLAFHVDYWNDLGWKDPFSSPVYTARQQLISKRNRQATVYTPEFVVDGKETRGSRKILAAVTATNAVKAPLAIQLNISLRSDRLLHAVATVSDSTQNPVQNGQFYAAVFENNLSGVIAAGENAGKTLHHDYVVRLWIGPLTATNEKTTNFDIALEQSWQRKNLGLAVIALDSNGDTILQAVKTSLATLF